MINGLVDEYAIANYDDYWGENLAHAHCPVRNKHYRQVSQLRDTYTYKFSKRKT
jgi:hypothetical protein